jgi:hypothetical protein
VTFFWIEACSVRLAPSKELSAVPRGTISRDGNWTSMDFISSSHTSSGTTHPGGQLRGGVREYISDLVEGRATPRQGLGRSADDGDLPVILVIRLRNLTCQP